MIELLKQFSITQILIFSVILALAIKSIFTFFDWAKVRMTQAVHQNEKPDKLEDRIDKLEEGQESLTNSLSRICQKLDLLINSDRDDIKAYITEKHHHYVYKKKWIDDYTMSILEERYNHYKAYGGNSFIRGLMDQLRALPKQNFQATIEKTVNK